MQGESNKPRLREKSRVFEQDAKASEQVQHLMLQDTQIWLAASGGEGVTMDERLDLLRRCLALFQGVHAFHNFTKRRLYREESSDSKQGRQRRVHTGIHCCQGCLIWHCRRADNSATASRPGTTMLGKGRNPYHAEGNSQSSCSLLLMGALIQNPAL